QMRIDPGRKKENLRWAVERIDEAAARGARVALLPEAMPLGWTDSSSPMLAAPVPDGETSALLCATRNSPESGRGLTENLAREILELHTLGVRSGYTQEDVTELARALTVWSV